MNRKFNCNPNLLAKIVDRVESQLRGENYSIIKTMREPNVVLEISGKTIFFCECKITVNFCPLSDGIEVSAISFSDFLSQVISFSSFVYIRRPSTIQFIREQLLCWRVIKLVKEIVEEIYLVKIKPC